MAFEIDTINVRLDKEDLDVLRNALLVFSSRERGTMSRHKAFALRNRLTQYQNDLEFEINRNKNKLPHELG